MAGRSSLGGRLYRGETTFPIVSRRRLWYAVAGAIILTCVLGLAVRGFNLGIEFKGGSEFRFPAQSRTVEQVRSFVTGLDVGGEPTVQTVGGDIRVETPPLTVEKQDDVGAKIRQQYALTANDLATSAVGASWGNQITNKAVQGLVAFLIAVVIYLSIRFEPKMAAGALVALLHDLIITAGVYALVGFEVTPGSVIGLLTILGYSLYDTVVVFDKVQENTRGILGGSRSTYGEAANLAVNQTLARSINTSLIALLPVAALLFVGAGLLGAGTLQDLSLALFIGIAAGTYSSIFVATPVLVDLKEREPQYQALTRRVLSRRSGATPAAGKPARAGSTAVAAAPVALAKSAEATGTARNGAAGTEATTSGAGAGTQDAAGTVNGDSDGDVARRDLAGVPGRTSHRAQPARRRSGSRGRPSGKRKR